LLFKKPVNLVSHLSREALESSLDDPSSYPLTIILGSIATYLTVSGIILLVLLVTSALVSGSEVAFFSLNQSDLDEHKGSSRPANRALVNLLARPKQLLATILILNNLVNVAIVTLATFVTWRITGTHTMEGTVFVILAAAVTFIIVFFGEVIPKVYAAQNNLKMALFMAVPLSFFNSLLKPLSLFLTSMSNIIEKRIEKRGYDLSMKELNEALEITADGETTHEEKEILKGIMSFGTISVRQVMRSRIDITAIDVEMDFHQLLDIINKSGFSRMPVYKESIDHIEGVLYIKDLLPYLDRDEKFAWQKLLRKGYFVPENKKIYSLLRDFQEKRVHMAIVVDEYGGTSGLITLEDLIEEIVGEINDEFDEEEIAHRKLDDKTFDFEGKTSLNDFCKIVGEDPMTFDDVKGESESLGGLLLEIHSELPNAGETIKYGKYVFTVTSVDRKRIKKVRVLINESSIDGDEETRLATSN